MTTPSAALEVALVDTRIGNVRSVERALAAAAERAGVVARIERTADPAALARADRVVVPGQGAFRDFAAALDRLELRAALLGALERGVPYLGICLGLQALFESSEEAPEARGLGWLAGTVVRLHPEPGVKIPHMGWNQLRLAAGGHPLLEAAGGERAWLYFVHSFHAVPSRPEVVRATVTHGASVVTAAVASGAVFASQFHPEKSQDAGLALLSAFLRDGAAE
ncbi:MAG: imidazole glycerol phosphate synthase subunit HisH [Polyangiaceae bacterium]|nr:imidazole glycerol phosphate synthase subunit HisH [Polyangiaceae bacterium]